MEFHKKPFHISQRWLMISLHPSLSKVSIAAIVALAKVHGSSLFLDAHLYFLRRVIHNFNDEDCKVILKQIAVAMGPTSRLLVGEFILPDQAHIGDDFTIRWMDFAMITLSGKERTRAQFEELFETAGLELVRVWPFLGPGQPQSVIETKLQESRA